MRIAERLSAAGSPDPVIHSANILRTHGVLSISKASQIMRSDGEHSTKSGEQIPCLPFTLRESFELQSADTSSAIRGARASGEQP